MHSRNCVHTRLHSTVAHVDEEYINSRLRGSDHVLGGCDKLDYSVVQLGTRPAVSRLIPSLVPVKQLRDLIRHTAHTAAPAKENDRLSRERLKEERTDCPRQ
jgi:hypothetical protein